MNSHDDEEELLRSVTLQNARSILLARQRAEEDLVKAREALEHKSAELAQSVSILRATLESTTDGILVTDSNKTVTGFNTKFVEMWRIPDEVMDSRQHARLLEVTSRQLKDPGPVLARVEAIYASSPPESYDLLELSDGRFVERFSTIQFIDDRNAGRVWSFRDITDRRLADESLRQSEARLRIALNAGRMGTWDWDIRSNRITWSPDLEAIHGLAPGSFAGSFADYQRDIHPEDRELVTRSIAQTLEEGKDYLLEYRLVWPDGTIHWVETRGKLLRNETGTPLRMIGVCMAIDDRKCAEEALRQSEAQFRQLADALPQIVWTARPDGFIDYYNERWYEFTGFKRDDFGDSSWKPILHPDDIQRCADTYYGCIRSGNLYQIEYRFRDLRTGGYRWFLGRAYPVRNEHGDIVRWFGTCTDIDDTKQAEETTHFLADASAALAELTDYSSTLRRVAGLAVPFFADWCAVDIQEADGSIRRLAVTHPDPTKVALAHELFRRYPPQPSDRHGLMRVLLTGESEWASVISDSFLVESAHDEEHLGIIKELGLKSYICVPLRSRSRTLGALTFVTAESGRIYDLADLAAAEDLANRAVIAIENANLLGTLKESDRRKDEFLAMLAHELRNPLAPIRNAVQILRGGGPPVSELQWATDVIDRQVHQMTRLVDDLLDVSRITTGKIELRPEHVELATVVKNAVEGSRPFIEKRCHELTVTIPPLPIELEADPTRLTQVLLNLLNNAAKYTDDGGRIWLTAEHQSDHVLIRVRDTGIGISQEMLPHIFDMFTQVEDSFDRSQGGLGIGLTLVKRLVELHRGDVEARSDGPGKGSEFVVRLPLAAKPGDEDRQGPAVVEKVVAPTKRRILVVDDNRDAADSLGMLLLMLGNEVKIAYDGLEALEAAEAFQPDVVLLDIGMPKLSGYEAAHRIRKQRGGSDMILVALTGWGKEEDRRRSSEAGFDHHMTKPVEFAALQELLEESNPARP